MELTSIISGILALMCFSFAGGAFLGHKEGYNRRKKQETGCLCPHCQRAMDDKD